jgi:hypothetical protein
MGFVNQESQQNVEENATTRTTDENENAQPFHHNDNFINLDMYMNTLFVLNGLVQVIPNLALMALINDRIKLPVEYIPAYYAIEFLPYSLKPLYGIITYWITDLCCMKYQYHHQHHQSGISSNDNEQDEEWIDNDRGTHSSPFSRNMVTIQRYYLLIFLQICASLSFILTATLQQNQIIQCFIMGFIRSFTISWAEFLLGLALISSVKSKLLLEWNIIENNSNNETTVTMLIWRRNREEKLLSMHQSQAATSRNVGSLVGQIIMFSVILIHKYYVHKDDGDDILNSFFILFMILGTAMIPLVAAFIAYKGKVGTSVERYQIRNTSTWRSNQGRNSYDMISPGDRVIPNTSNSQCPIHSLFRIKRIALYLILRHAMPSTSGIVGSFEYTVFRSNPLYLQCMALITSICAVLASSFYGRYISTRFANIKDIAWIIIITTIISSVWSLLFLPFYHEFRGEEGNDIMNDDGDNSIMYQESLTMLIMFAFFQVVQSFFEEISFLPSVVIATNAVVKTDVTNNISIMSTDVILPQESNEETNGASDDYRMEQVHTHQSWYLNDGILYGFMISCIDLGDQIGDWITGPIVKGLHIQRENNWDNLNLFIIISFIAGIFSLVFLRLLWYSSKPIDR